MGAWLGKQKSLNQNKRSIIILENNKPIPDKFRKNNITIVRVWTSEYNRRCDIHKLIFCSQCGSSPPETILDLIEKEVEENKGHVSMELIFNSVRGTKANGTYLSFGPEKDSPQNPLQRHDAQNIENYKSDLEYMKCKPDYTIIFYSLNVANMNEAIEKLTEIPIEKQKWTLTGPRCNLGNGDESWTTKMGKRIRFYWWLLWQSICALIRLPLDRVMISSESKHPEMDPTADLKCDENGEITMSCVSSVFYVLHKGGFTSKLLPRKVQRRVIAANATNESVQSSKNIMQVDLEEILNNAGFIFHLSISSVVISPDAFLCIVKYAKKQEMLKKKNKKNEYQQLEFINDDINFHIGASEEKETVTCLEWVPCN